MMNLRLQSNTIIIRYLIKIPTVYKVIIDKVIIISNK